MLITCPKENWQQWTAGCRFVDYEGQDGQRRWITEVVADTVRFLSPKDSGESSSMDLISAEIESDDDLPF